MALLGLAWYLSKPFWKCQKYLIFLLWGLTQPHKFDLLWKAELEEISIWLNPVWSSFTQEKGPRTSDWAGSYLSSWPHLESFRCLITFAKYCDHFRYFQSSKSNIIDVSRMKSTSQISLKIFFEFNFNCFLQVVANYGSWTISRILCISVSKKHSYESYKGLVAKQTTI